MKIEELSVGQRVRYSYGAPALTCNMMLDRKDARQSEMFGEVA